VFTKVATDGTNVYWGGGSTADADGFVMATVVDTDAQTSFPSGQPVTLEFTVYSSVIDHHTGVAGAKPTGLAVQQSLHGTGHKGYLFVARQGQTSVDVLDKTTGALIQSLTFAAVGDLAVDGSDNLWMLCVDGMPAVPTGRETGCQREKAPGGVQVDREAATTTCTTTLHTHDIRDDLEQWAHVCVPWNLRSV
jgi:hypothetical protein